MAFLKPIRAEITENARSLNVKDLKGTLKGRKAKEDRELWQEFIAGAQAEFDKYGEATSLTVYGLPIKGGTQNPERSKNWMIAQDQWEAADDTPLRLPITASNTGTGANERILCDIWVFARRVHLALDTDLSPSDVRALLDQEKNKRRLALEKAHALQAMTERLDKPRQRERIQQEVRIEVWQRDNGRCVECGSQENLEFDHIIPFAMGGSSTARNLQLLCGDCNRRKGMTLG